MNGETERDPNAPYWSGKFSVEDRVQVRLSPECRAGWHDCEQDCQIGTIRYSNVSYPHIDQSHPYAVVFDNPYPDPADGVPVIGAWFAATEIERLEAPNG